MICLSLSDERVHLNVAQNKTVLFSMNVIARLLGEPSIAQRMNEMSADQLLLTGSSGLIGTSLIRSLRHKRISTITLRRRSVAARRRYRVLGPLCRGAGEPPGTRRDDRRRSISRAPTSLDGDGPRLTNVKLRDSRIIPTTRSPGRWLRCNPSRPCWCLRRQLASTATMGTRS